MSAGVSNTKGEEPILPGGAKGRKGYAGVPDPTGRWGGRSDGITASVFHPLRFAERRWREGPETWTTNKEATTGDEANAERKGFPSGGVPQKTPGCLRTTQRDLTKGAQGASDREGTGLPRRGPWPDVPQRDSGDDRQEGLRPHEGNFPRSRKGEWGFPWRTATGNTRV